MLQPPCFLCHCYLDVFDGAMSVQRVPQLLRKVDPFQLLAILLNGVARRVSQIVASHNHAVYSPAHVHLNVFIVIRVT